MRYQYTEDGYPYVDVESMHEARKRLGFDDRHPGVGLTLEEWNERYGKAENGIRPVRGRTEVPTDGVSEGIGL